MIRIFTGDDRVRANQEIKKILGEDYEVIDCTDLDSKALPLIFLGTTLFSTNRRILLRDFTANHALFPELTKYLNTPHEIILLETKLDKRTTTYRELKDQIEIKEFKLPPATDYRLLSNIYHTAKKDGPKSVAMLKKIESSEDPIKFTGLLATEAIKDFENTNCASAREKAILKKLSRLDIQLKTTTIDPWLLVESFLLRLES